MNKIKYILFSLFLSLVYINHVNAAATCVYEVSYQTGSPTTKAKVSCTASNSGVNCTSENLSIEKSGIALTPDNFKKNNVYICPNYIFTFIDAINMNIIGISPIKGTEPGWNKLNIVKEESKDDSSLVNNENKPTTPTPAPPTNNENEFTPESFCKGPVQGVFTTLGWVFFIIKIVVPILLIIFGSIDIGKAVIANKDDEIKKSIKTLGIRAVAGIIIFFVPTILNFIVKLIDDSDIYNGTFWDCTKCMLNPTDDVCSSLRGEE